eukprot:2406691-Amphidinium_carterae.1
MVHPEKQTFKGFGRNELKSLYSKPVPWETSSLQFSQLLNCATGWVGLVSPSLILTVESA